MRKQKRKQKRKQMKKDMRKEMKEEMRKEMKRPSYSVILPTYNERDNILPQIKEIFRHLPRQKTEIIVVDDNSPDRTWELVQNLSRREPHVRLLRRMKDRGIAASYADGIDMAHGRIICWMDCDLSMPAGTLPRLIRKVGKEKYDMAIGSRYAKGGKDDRPAIRKVTSGMVNTFASAMLGHGIRDYDSGFIAVRRAVFDKVKLSRKGYGEYFIEFVYNCARAGFRIAEVGYVFTDRAAGTSKSEASKALLLKHGMRYGMKIIRLRLGRE